VSAYFRNIGIWGHTAKDWASLVDADIFLFAETHEPPEKSNELLTWWERAGYRAVVSPAHETKTSIDGGGVLAAIRRHYSAWSFRHLASHASQAIGLRDIGKKFVPGPIDFTDFVPIQFRVNQITFTIICVYLTASIGLKGENIRKLAMLGSFVNTLRGPWLAIGDWNLLHTVLTRSNWIDEVKACVRVPEDTSYTCRRGSGRMIDYAVMSRDAVPFIEISSDDTGDFKDHFGLKVKINMSPEVALCRSLALPKAFAHPARPKKQVDPESKRQRKKVESEQKQSSKPKVINFPEVIGRRKRIDAKTPPPLCYLDGEAEPDDDDQY